MTNQDILDKLLLRQEDNTDENIPVINSVNGYMFAKNMKDWDVTESFPVKDFKRYIRMNEWKTTDFNPRTELLIMKILPHWLHKVYLMMREFKASSRNELLSAQDAFARMMGYPTETPSDKAFCVYDYAIQMYYEEV